MKVNLNKLKNWKNMMPHQLSPFVNECIDSGNMLSGAVISAVACILKFWMLGRIYVYSKRPTYRPTAWIHGHVTAYMILECVSLFFLIYALRSFFKSKEGKSEHRKKMAMVLVYIVVCLGFGIYISVTDHHDSYLNYLTMMVCSFCLFVIHPINTVVIASGSMGAYLYMMNRVSELELSYGTRINIFMLTIVLMVVNILRYDSTVKYAVKIEDTDRLNRQLEKLSYRDGLTNLKNRRALEKDLDEFEGVPRSVALIDIDDFKYFNDSFGHQYGDRLLRHLADTLSQFFDAEQCYRYGGDEFLLVCPECEKTDFEEKIAKWQECFGDYRDEERVLHLTCSIGFAFARDEEETSLSKLIRKADYHLYTVKRMHKTELGSLPVFEADSDEVEVEQNAEVVKEEHPGTDLGEYTDGLSSLDEQVNRKRQYTLKNIDEAIEKRYIRPFFQPIIDVKTGNVVAREVLSRWDKGDNEYLMPKDFVEALEHSRQIYRLDLFILSEICKEYVDAGEKGNEFLPATLNLSRLDFSLCNIVEIVDARCKEAGMPPQLLHIEVTETAADCKESDLIEGVRRFRELGYEVWIDDFGSGNASVNILTKIQCDVLKIDHNIVMHLEDDERSKVVFTAIVNLAGQLGIRTLAEGVETDEQFAIAQSLGCDYVQGFRFGKPTPES